jgi:hypothetical protein
MLRSRRVLRAAPAQATTVAVAAVLIGGCAATDSRPRDAAPAATTSRAAAPSAEPALVAIADGATVTFDALRPALVELGGEVALRDALLDLRLAKRLASQGVAVDEADIAREETLLLEALASDRARAVELLGEIRARQGLGPVRYAALLRRNAGLRALVAPAVAVDEAGTRAIFDMRHGATREARIAVVGSLAEAEALRAERAAGTPFSELAVRRSRHESAARGGLLAPFARLDPSYPEALRAAVFAGAVGSVSEPLLDDGRFIVAEIVAERPGDGTGFDAARAACEEVLRRNRERLLMEELARELSATDGATIFDRAFDRPRR